MQEVIYDSGPASRESGECPLPTTIGRVTRVIGTFSSKSGVEFTLFLMQIANGDVDIEHIVRVSALGKEASEFAQRFIRPDMQISVTGRAATHSRRHKGQMMTRRVLYTQDIRILS